MVLDDDVVNAGDFRRRFVTTDDPELFSRRAGAQSTAGHPEGDIPLCSTAVKNVELAFEFVLLLLCSSRFAPTFVRSAGSF